MLILLTISNITNTKSRFPLHLPFFLFGFRATVPAADVPAAAEVAVPAAGLSMLLLESSLLLLASAVLSIPSGFGVVVDSEPDAVALCSSLIGTEFESESWVSILTSTEGIHFPETFCGALLLLALLPLVAQFVLFITLSPSVLKSVSISLFTSCFISFKEVEAILEVAPTLLTDDIIWPAEDVPTLLGGGVELDKRLDKC